MRIVIAGCGRVGSNLAVSLDAQGHTIAIIDIEPSGFQRLGSDFRGSTHQGSAYDPDALREAGIDDADAFAAATGSDNVNAIAVHIAKQAFGVTAAIARLNDPHRQETYRVLDIAFVADAAACADAMRESLLGRHSFSI